MCNYVRFLKNNKVKRATIKDIAKYLGISHSTVSRALSGHPDLSDATRNKVIEVANLLNYTPNLRAKYLRTSRSGLIALILPEINMFFSPSLINAINKQVEAKEYSLIILQSENSLKREQELVQYCINNAIEGVMVSLSEETNDLSHLNALTQEEIPVVLLDKIIEDDAFSSISLDEAEAGYKAINYLLSKGHKHIVGIFGNSNLRMTRYRKDGFLKAFEDQHIAINPHQVLEVDHIAHFESAFAQVLHDYPEATAYFTMSDELMVQTYHQLLKHGIQIPKEKVLLSISDGKAPYYLFPNITHLEHSGYNVGEQAIQCLFEHIQDAKAYKPKNLKYQTTLVELQSV